MSETIKKSPPGISSIIHSFLMAAMICLIALSIDYNSASAANISSDSDRPLVQNDENDIAPLPVPDTPQAPGPDEIQDDALSPDSVISDPDPPIDETEPYVVEPVEPENGEEQQEYYPDENNPESYIDLPELLVDEPDPLVDHPDPLVDHPHPLVEQSDPLVDQLAPLVKQPDPLVDQPAPLVKQPDPLVAKPAPLVRQPRALVNEPPALVNHPRPLVDMPEPLVRQPDPLVNRSAP